MKKLSMMFLFALSASVLYAQDMTFEEWQRQRTRYGCNGAETLAQCKERARRQEIERKHIEDSLKREGELVYNQYLRDQWERAKARRAALTPEERAAEDQERRIRFEHDKKKKADEEPFDFTAGALRSNIPAATPPYNPLLGIHFGIHMQVIPLSDDIHLGAGIEYSMQGGKSTSYEYIPGGDYSTSSSPTRLNYLNLPILARYQRNQRGFFAEAGLQPGLLLSAKKKGSNVKENFKKFDIGIPVGAGYKFKNKIGVGAHVIPGLMNISKNKELKNRNFVASLDVSYSL